jgi:hypothetical protein
VGIVTFEDLTKREALQELRELRRLHEACTERNVALAATIAEAEEAVRFADRNQLSGLDTRMVLRAVFQPADAARSLRVVKHLVLRDLAAELDAKELPGIAVGSGWLRKRAIGELLGEASK